MHPNTGALLALVSTPSYNPNDFVLGMSTEKWNTIKNNEAKEKNMYTYTNPYVQNYTFEDEKYVFFYSFAISVFSSPRLVSRSR